ncbi:MAG: NUDIX domain-containing protein [Parvularcula sp.]|nr:NUDIX domain-containing protein [Parvularcula sp.]
MTQETLWVVAGALAGPDETWLMHRRPYAKHHGGLWEFPGGKIEDAEIPVNALLRELGEELGVEVRESDCEPIAFAEDRSGECEQAIVILLYTVGAWRGEPRALEGGDVGWFTPPEIARLDKPPLDCELAKRLFAVHYGGGQE